MALAAFGLTNDTISLFGGFSSEIFPPSPRHLTNTFRVYVGATRSFEVDAEAESRSMGGNAPALAAWDVAGGFLNQVTPNGVTPPKIGAGKFRDYAIEGRGGAEYMSVVRTGNDGVCIYMITG